MRLDIRHFQHPYPKNEDISFHGSRSRDISDAGVDYFVE